MWHKLPFAQNIGNYTTHISLVSNSDSGLDVCTLGIVCIGSLGFETKEDSVERLVINECLCFVEMSPAPIHVVLP